MNETPQPERERRLEEAIAEYLQAVEGGQAPDREEFIARHPDLADGLRSFFADRDHFQQMAGAPVPPEGARPVPPVTPSAASSPTADPTLGKVRYVGDYELLEEIARGGMGVVFRARQVSLNRQVAVKMILAGQLASAADVDRFRREAQTVARLDHPAIVPIYEVGEHEGQHYFSMKLIEGENLAARMPRLREDVRSGVRLLVMVARAVQYANDQGILHRDLKPGNILVDGVGQAHLTDFGLARMLGGTGRTAPGAILGTPGYMAPEQAGGPQDQVTGRTDVYGLGAVLYEMLTGRPPFQAATPMDTLLRVIGEEPVPPRKVDVRVPRDLETICLKCLSKEPARRYASAGELADDLERWLNGVPIRARRVGRTERLWRWGRRNPAKAAVIGVIAAALLVVSGLAIDNAIKEARQRAFEQRVEEAQQTMKQGMELCQQGQIDEGMLWLARALEQAPAGATDLRHSIRENLRGWYRIRESRPVLPQETLDRVFPSPDGKTFLTESQHKVAQLWDATTGKVAGEPIYFPNTIWKAAFGEDGKTLVVPRPKPVSRLWAEKEEVAKVWLQGGVVSRYLSPDGKLLATGSSDGTARLWDAATGEPLGEPFPHPEKDVHPSFSPDGKALMVTSGGGADFAQRRVVRIWNIASRKLIFSLDDNQTWPTFSPDGRLIYHTGTDNTGQLYHALTGEAAGAPMQHPAAVRDRFFASDGKKLFTRSADGKVRLWDCNTGRRIGDLLTVSQDAAVRCSADARFLAEVTDRHTGKPEARIWDVATAKRLGPALRHHREQWTSAVQFSPDGKMLTTVTDDNLVLLWDTTTGKEIAQLPHPQTLGQPNNVEFSPDGRTVLTTTDQKIGCLWDCATGKKLGEMRSPLSDAIGAEFSPDGTHLRIVGYGRRCQLWEAATGKPLGAPFRGSNARFSPDGKWVAAQVNQGVCRFWSAATGKPGGDPFPQTLPWVSDDPTAVREFFSPDSSSWVIREGRKTTRVRRVGSGEPLGEAIEHPNDVSGIAFHPDGKRVLTVCKAKPAQYWDSSTGKAIGPGLPQLFEGFGIAFNREGNRLLVLPPAPSLRAVDTGEPIGNDLGRRGQVVTSFFSPDGRTLLTLTQMGQAHLWDAATGDPIGDFLHYLPGSADTALYSPDSSMVLTAYIGDGDGADEPVAALRELLPLLLVLQVGPGPGPPPPLKVHKGVAQLWDATTGKRVGKPFLHPQKIGTVAISRDGKTVATGSEDRTARLWDVATRRPLGPPLPHSDPVVRVDFTADGKHLLTRCHTGGYAQCRLWPVSPPFPETAEAVSVWVQVVTRMRLENGAAGDLDETTWQRLRKRLEELGGPVP